MVVRTRHLRKDKKQGYRFKTQKGGFTPQIIAEISAQISARLGPILSNLLQRSEASGSTGLATRSIAETGTAAAETLISALQRVVQQALSRNPALAREAPTITNEILTSATARLAQSASATAGSSAAAAAAALAASAGAALSTSTAAVASALGSSLASAARNPQTARLLVQLLRSRVLPSVQRSIQSLLRSGRADAAREAAALVNPAVSRAAAQTGLTALGRAAAARPTAFTRALGVNVTPFGIMPRRLPGALARRPPGARGFSTQVNGSSAASQSAADIAAQFNSSVGKARQILTNAEIENAEREVLKRIWESVNGPLPKHYRTEKMRPEVQEIMVRWRQENMARFGFEAPPPVKPVGIPQTSDLVAQAAKDLAQKSGGSAADLAATDKAIHASKEGIKNAVDLTLKPSPNFVNTLTNPNVMGQLTKELPAVANNASGLLDNVLKSPIGKALEAVRFDAGSLEYYKTFGERIVDPVHIQTYNRNVENAIRLLLEKAPKEEIEALLQVVSRENMVAFRGAFFDYFLTAPQAALRALETIVTQIIPHHRLTPDAFSRIITTLQQEPDTLPRVLTQIVGQRAAASSEVSFASMLWRARGMAQTFGRYSVLGIGAASVLFLAAVYGVTNIGELLWHLRTDLGSFGLSSILTSAIDSADRAYDAIWFAITGRNTEHAISEGIIAPIGAAATATRAWFTQFMQAGRPPTILESLATNLNTILDRVGRDRVMMFGGLTVVGIMIYQARQQAQQQQAAALAALAPPPLPPPGNGAAPAQPPVPPGNGAAVVANAPAVVANAPAVVANAPAVVANAPAVVANAPAAENNNWNAPNLPPRAFRPRENFGIAAIQPRANLAAVPLPPPPPGNNF